jgi:anti-anti-sigma factor
MSDDRSMCPFGLPDRSRLQSAADRLGEFLARRAGGLAGREVRLDLGSVESVESRELGALITLSRRARQAGGRLSLVNVGPQVVGVLRATRLDTILNVKLGDN